MNLGIAYKVLLMSFLLRNQHAAIYLIAAFLSIFLSLDGYLRATVINPDGICYLQSAAAISSLGVHGAMQLCGQAHWPFYSILIFGLSSL
jgi:hypothetical protein